MFLLTAAHQRLAQPGDGAVACSRFEQFVSHRALDDGVDGARPLVRAVVDMLGLHEVRDFSVEVAAAAKAVNAHL